MVPAERERKSSSISFSGRSGERYCFQAWPLDTKFKALGAVYIITKRECLDRTFASKASHRPLAIGHTADLAEHPPPKGALRKLAGEGANCICVLSVSDAAERERVTADLMQAHDRRDGGLQYLSEPVVPPHAPGLTGARRPGA